MENLIDIQKKIVPEVLSVMEKRYAILKKICMEQPIGRRGLASKLGLSERNVRSEVEFLKDQGFIDTQTSGMSITQEGMLILEGLENFIVQIRGLYKIEEIIKEKLGIKKVLVVPGNFDQDEFVIADIAKAAGKYLMSIIKKNSVIGVSGGSTMFEFSNRLTNNTKYKEVVVVPTRGGLGEKFEIQSNNIAAILSKNLGAHYKLLHVPDNIEKEVLHGLTSQPDVKEVLDYIKKLDILIFGVGRADQMAQRRKMKEDQIKKIIQDGAVSEVFGYYFDQDGNPIYETSTVGLDIEQFKSIKTPIALAGGSEKAQAIISISKINKDLTLVLDEGAAGSILEIYK